MDIIELLIKYLSLYFTLNVLSKKLNRNMLLHGMYEKEITELEFFQLLNVVHNMVERLDDWKEKMI